MITIQHQKTKKALDFIDNANKFRTIILGCILAFYLPFIGLYCFYYWNFKKTKF
jgi:hypothetical protein